MGVMDFRIFLDFLLRKIFLDSRPFVNSNDYWCRRYKIGGNSGAGSYSELADLKANTLNSLITELGLSNMIELGCGDGAQLKKIKMKNYIGLDISQRAIEICKKKYLEDKTKSFFLYNEFNWEESADASLSLDVIFHLVEDDVFDEYMRRLFRVSNKYVIIYSSNTDNQMKDSPKHVRHRKFTDWIKKFEPKAECIKRIDISSKTPAGYRGTFCDFYIYEKK